MKKLAALLFCLSFAACKKDQADPQPPEIEFSGINYLQKDADGTDLLIEVSIRFKDRNGDIGRHVAEKKDACGRDLFDLFLFYEAKTANGYYPLKFPGNDTLWDANCNFTIVDDSISLSFSRSVQFIEPEGNNKSIEGEIDYRLDYDAALILLSQNPVGRFRIYLLDRMGQKSNEVYSDDLIITP